MRDQGGAIVLFVLVLFLFVAVTAGVAVDLARHYAARADMQKALDRGVLAAANRTSDVTAVAEAEAEAVIHPCMASRTDRDLAYTLTVDGPDTAFGRDVSATAEVEVDTIFLPATGVTSLEVPATAGAAQAFGLTEVVLMLDVWGSMGWNSSATEAKTAIQSLRPENDAASSVGLTWGAALLDPGTSDLLQAQITAGDVDTAFTGGPRRWSDMTGRKIVMPMTDGVNTKQQRPDPKRPDPKRPDPSGYAEDGADGFGNVDTFMHGTLCRAPLYDCHSLSCWLGEPSDIEDVVNDAVDGVGDQQLLTLCSRLSAQPNAVICTIGVELGTGTIEAAHANGVLSRGATSPTSQDMVEGVDISTAFAHLATELKTLTLVR
ncbi:MAG: pilus assembly protein TadG-related protein [Pseudomonadota bacterium]